MSNRRLFLAGATGAVGHALLDLATKRKVDVLAHVRRRAPRSWAIDRWRPSSCRTRSWSR